MPKHLKPARNHTPAPPPAVEPKPKHMSYTALGQWELREAVDAWQSARERRAEAARAAYLGRDRAAWDWQSVSDDTVDSAGATIARCVLLLSGAAEDVEAFDDPLWTWRPCGVRIEGQSSYLVWVEPDVDNEGRTSYSPAAASVTVCDLAECDDLAEDADA